MWVATVGKLKIAERNFVIFLFLINLLLKFLDPFDGENIFYFFSKQATMRRRSTVLSLPVLLVFPGWYLTSWSAPQKLGNGQPRVVVPTIV